MPTAEDAVTDARKVLRSIVDRWERQRYSSPLKDRCEEFLDVIDGVPAGLGAAAEGAAIVSQSQPLREAVATADAGGYGGSLLAAARSLLAAMDIAGAGTGETPRSA